MTRRIAGLLLVWSVRFKTAQPLVTQQTSTFGRTRQTKLAEATAKTENEYGKTAATVTGKPY
jgi:hypothetical protein